MGQSAFGATIGCFGRYVTFFVSLEAISGASHQSVVQERGLSKARNGPMNFS